MWQLGCDFMADFMGDGVGDSQQISTCLAQVDDITVVLLYMGFPPGAEDGANA